MPFRGLEQFHDCFGLAQRYFLSLRDPKRSGSRRGETQKFPCLTEFINGLPQHPSNSHRTRFLRLTTDRDVRGRTDPSQRKSRKRFADDVRKLRLFD